MKDAFTKVSKFYDSNSQREWERLDVHRMEYSVTLKALKEYLPKLSAKILDIGGGPGRYALELTKQEYEVVLFDVSHNCLNFAKTKSDETGVKLAGYCCGTATNLQDFHDESFDVVLSMGPFYHLLTIEEREKALQEAYRVLKPGGIIFASFINIYAPVRDYCKHEPLYLFNNCHRIEELLFTGVGKVFPEETYFTDAYFIHPAKITSFMEKCFCTVDLISCEGIASLIDDELNKLQNEQWESWVDLNYRISKDPAVHGASEHLLYVGRKFERK